MAAITRSYALTESNGTYGTIYLSPDKGTTWESGGEIYESSLFIVRSDPNNGMFAVLGSSDGLYYTRDGGYTWIRSVGTYSATGSNVKDICYVDSDIIYAIGDNHVFKSINGGASFADWIATEDLYGPGAIGYSIHYINEYNGVIGIEDKVYITNDMGYTWAPGNADVALNAGEPVYSVAMNTDFLTINVCNINRIYQSVDNGINFAVTFTASAPFTNRQKLFRLDDNDLYMLSNNDGQVYLSVDAGATWTPQGTIAGAYGTMEINDLHFYDINDGILTPDATDIQITADSGVSFTAAVVAGSPNFISVTASDYICGECPEGWDFDADKGDCYRTVGSPPLCNDGYNYDPNLFDGAGGCYTEDCFRDIVFVVDNTSSISPTEMVALKSFLTAIVAQLNASLVSGDTEISIVTFNSTATNILNLTNNVANINAAIAGIGTSVNASSALIEGLCEATIELNLNGRLGAGKLVIVITDGCPQIGSCTYDGNTYDSGFMGPNQAALAMGKAMKDNNINLMVIGTGSTNAELQQVSYCLGNVPDPGNPLYQTLITWPFPSQNYANDYLYFQAFFSSLNTLLNPVVTNICYDAIIAECDEGWVTVIYGDYPDINAYCTLFEEFPVVPCCFLLEDCNGILPDIYTETNLSEYIDLIITIDGYPNTCWSITDLSDSGVFCLENQVQPVTVTSDHVSCLACIPSYKLYNCADNASVLYTIQDFSDYVSPSQVVTLVEYPDTCWQVGINYDDVYVPETLTVVNEFANCGDCLRKYYLLTNCNNPDIYFYSVEGALEDHLDKVITVAAYPGLCWKVEDADCDCIIVNILAGGLVVEEQLNSYTTINGKNAYAITIAGTDYIIAWDSVQNRWELFNANTLAVVSYSENQGDCPYSGAWVRVTMQVLWIKPCVTTFYGVDIAAFYETCECCLDKDCS